MNRSKINVRYARALFSLGKDNDQLSSLLDDITKVHTLCLRSDDFRKLLDNPVIKSSQKILILRKIFETKISDLALRFVILIVEQQREYSLEGICRYFIDLVRADKGIVQAVVTTAQPLSKEVMAEIHRNLEQETGKIIELSHKINPALIGGMIVRIEDFQYDGSISAQLHKLRAALTGRIS